MENYVQFVFYNIILDLFRPNLFEKLSQTFFCKDERDMLASAIVSTLINNGSRPIILQDVSQTL